MTSQKALNTKNAGDHPAGGGLVYLVKGNLAFVRLFSVLVEKIEGFSCEVYDKSELSAAASRRRPDVVAIIEEESLYRELSAWKVLADVPLLFLTVSEQSAGGRPDLKNKDGFWVLRNDPKELFELLRSLVPTPGRKSVLCVDDSRTVLNQIKRSFSGTPYELATASNGQEGLEALEELTPDLIITDVEMPVMDGVTFCRKVRSRPQTAEVPLIILSSRVDHKTIAAGFEAGADEYLTKPFYQDELLNKVEPYLAPAPTRRQEHVLLVSTGFNVTHQLKTALSKQGLVAAACRSPEEALIRAMKDRPDMIMAEEDLPGESGYQLCSRLREDPIQRKVPFILITDKVDGAARKMGDKVGVSAYLSKPFTRERVVMLAERLLAEQRSLTALEWDMILASIMSLAKALDERDPYTRFHSENVAKYALAIGRRAGMNAKELENLRLAGLLHDLGKIGIPDKVLHKPGRLTDEEFGQIKEHCQRGAEILKPITSLENIIPAILHHHERIDGGGYPSGLSSDQIPYMARILATADTYDALVTDRPYRRGMPREQALSILKEVAGTQLDAEYVRIFIKWVKDAGDAAA